MCEGNSGGFVSWGAINRSAYTDMEDEWVTRRVTANAPLSAKGETEVTNRL